MKAKKLSNKNLNSNLSYKKIYLTILSALALSHIPNAQSALFAEYRFDQLVSGDYNGKVNEVADSSFQSKLAGNNVMVLNISGTPVGVKMSNANPAWKSTNGYSSCSYAVFNSSSNYIDFGVNKLVKEAVLQQEPITGQPNLTLSAWINVQSISNSEGKIIENKFLSYPSVCENDQNSSGVSESVSCANQMGLYVAPVYDSDGTQNLSAFKLRFDIATDNLTDRSQTTDVRAYRLESDNLKVNQWYYVHAVYSQGDRNIYMITREKNNAVDSAFVSSSIIDWKSKNPTATDKEIPNGVFATPTSGTYFSIGKNYTGWLDEVRLFNDSNKKTVTSTDSLVNDVYPVCGLNYLLIENPSEALACTPTENKDYYVRITPFTYLDKPITIPADSCVGTNNCKMRLATSSGTGIGYPSNPNGVFDLAGNAFADVKITGTSGQTYSFVTKNYDGSKTVPSRNDNGSGTAFKNTYVLRFAELDPVTKNPIPTDSAFRINNQIAGKPSHLTVEQAITQLNSTSIGTGGDATAFTATKAGYSGVTSASYDNGVTSEHLKRLYGTQPQTVGLFVDYCSGKISTTSQAIYQKQTITEKTLNPTCTSGSQNVTFNATKNVTGTINTTCTNLFTKTVTTALTNNSSTVTAPLADSTIAGSTVIENGIKSQNYLIKSYTYTGTTALSSCPITGLGTGETCVVNTTNTKQYTYTNTNGLLINSTNYTVNLSKEKAVWAHFSTNKATKTYDIKDISTNQTGCTANTTTTCTATNPLKTVVTTKNFDVTTPTNYVYTTDTTSFPCPTNSNTASLYSNCVNTPTNPPVNSTVLLNLLGGGTTPINFNFNIGASTNTPLGMMYPKSNPYYYSANDAIRIESVNKADTVLKTTDLYLKDIAKNSTVANNLQLYFTTSQNGTVVAPFRFAMSTNGLFNFSFGYGTNTNSISSLTGKTNTFVVKPALLRMVNTDSSDTSQTDTNYLDRGGVRGDLTACIGNANNCKTQFVIKNPKASSVEYETDTNKSPKVFVRSGDPFHVRLRAEFMPLSPFNTKIWQDLDFGAFGFGKERNKTSVGLEVDTLLDPSTGSKGFITGEASNFCYGDSGLYQLKYNASTPTGCILNTSISAVKNEYLPAITSQFSNTFTWNEIGSIKVKPILNGGSYFGAGPIPGTISDPIGRFYPHHYETETVTSTEMQNINVGVGYLGRDIFHKTQPLKNACSAFTYARQPFSGLFKVVAKNKSGNTLSNYFGTQVLWTDDIGSCKPPVSKSSIDKGDSCLTQLEDEKTKYDLNNNFDWAVKVGAPTGSSCYPSPFKDNSGAQACPAIDRGDKPLGMGQTCTYNTLTSQYEICTQFNKPKPSKTATQRYHNLPTMDTNTNIRRYSDAQAPSHLVIEHSETGEEYVRVRTSSSEKVTGQSTNQNVKIMQPFDDRKYYYYLNLSPYGKDTQQKPLMQGYPQEEAELYPTQYQDLWVERWFAKTINDPKEAIFDIRDVRWNMWVQAPTENDVLLRFVKTIDEPHPAIINPAKINSALSVSDSPINKSTKALEETKLYNTIDDRYSSKSARLNRSERIKTYFGRMYMGGGFSPKDVDLPMELRTEYWDPTNDFLIMSNDSCTYTESPTSRKTMRLHPMIADVTKRTDQFTVGGYEQPKDVLIAPDGVKAPDGGQTLIASGTAGTGSTQTNGYVIRSRSGVYTPTTYYAYTDKDGVAGTTNYTGPYQRGELVYYPLSLFNKLVTGDSWASIRGSSADTNPATYVGSIPRFDNLKTLSNRSAASPTTIPSGIVVNTNLALPNNPMQMCIPQFGGSDTSETDASICGYTSQVTGNLTSKTNTRFTKSYGNLLISRPVSKECGYFDVTVTAPYWLQFTWDYDQVKYNYALADYPIDYRDSPHGRATFCASPSDTWNSYKAPYYNNYRQIFDYQNYK